MPHSAKKKPFRSATFRSAPVPITAAPATVPDFGQSEVQINATMVEPFGARIEVKRDSAFGTLMTDPHQTEPEIDRSVESAFADESTETARLTV